MSSTSNRQAFQRANRMTRPFTGAKTRCPYLIIYCLCLRHRRKIKMNKPKARQNLLITRLLKTLSWKANTTKFPTNHRPLPSTHLLLTNQRKRSKTQPLSQHNPFQNCKLVIPPFLPRVRVNRKRKLSQMYFMRTS